MLKIKNNSIACHQVREAAAADTIHIAKEYHESNIADMLTKPDSGPPLKALCEWILFSSKVTLTFIFMTTLRGLFEACHVCIIYVISST
jgi:hypothetical protein